MATTDEAGPWLVQRADGSVERPWIIDEVWDLVTAEARGFERSYESYLRVRVTLHGLPAVDVERRKVGCQWRWDVTRHSLTEQSVCRRDLSDWSDQAMVWARSAIQDYAYEADGRAEGA